MWNKSEVEAKTKFFIDNPNWVPQPKDCKAEDGFFIATFGKCEIETVAQMITLLSQYRGAWAQNFSEGDLRRLWKWPRKSASWVAEWLDALCDGYKGLEGGYLQVEVKKGWFGKRYRMYSVTRNFAQKLLQSQLRMARISMGIANDHDIMESLGLKWD